MSGLQLISSTGSFGGKQQRYQHHSDVLNCNMHVSVYLPPQVSSGNRLPVVYWLSGLTCTDENFVTKAGAHRIAAELGLILVAPDTSPRGDDVADDEGYDLGKGAGFYVNATQAPWQSHYRMYDYIVDELPDLVNRSFQCKSKAALAGHSMGGHGSLVLGLSNMQRYTSISAFAPIVNPINCPWGQKALTAYLGEDQKQWQQYDACTLLEQQGNFLQLPILIDQGLDDDFLDSQKLTRPFDDLVKKMKYPAQINYHQGYDHSYYFIATMIESHLRFHHRYLINQ
ncbi:S-formylglutathione hydrolase [Aliiglaciecola sp. LCG003]|uniref:S-formylglutathione hydrolase n=1 Tax=Aliiglaciecola sp. LCG003 TaxID=3053655 RepID=UPI0025722B90|nr:S-formylglutathione hydrolase [Aliiglaciecola sp. LCG003]WJG10474.1 S-formylglutathione hydrolase [Aliiglaciecola sp. LCG003]